ncbi:restriction endonuclease subunit S [Flavobacterium sp.]|jgi:restriction endonuclease S subunit|uniref:restriction endonuclease subunit S n=2 Tax=Flavobacterium sp. TaxID=239 RepID=UPI0022CC5779|nr:restriction endonuclease subunit S [Flavobacterium sp.]MCZ8145675.1 restriction endonuclease subunit S [Flavobacterium sp.]MCZ8366125.1 restriction endonuclease subunit S [Flavobacterium sp.]
MEGSVHSYLKFIAFPEFNLWDVKAYTSKKITSKFPLVKLNNLLSTDKMEWVEIEDDKEYPILGVRANGKGVYLNRIAKGSELTMKKYQKSKVNYLFYCKVRTVNGQWGVVYPEFENTYGSSNMQYLKIDETKINFKYFELLLSIKKLTDEFDKNAVGADGRHFTLKTLLSLEIPLPSLREQNIIVNNYSNQINNAEKLLLEASDLENEIERYLLNELGVKVNSTIEKSSLLQFINFEETNRWDTLFLLGKIPTLKSKYPLVNFSKVIKFFNKDHSNKSIRVDSSKFPNEEFRYIGMEHIEKETGRLLDMPIVKGKEIKSQTIKVPKDFIVYGKLRPYLNKYWINQTEYDNIICSSEFFVFDIDNGINKLFFKNVLSSKIIQDQISDKTSGARMPRINEEIFFNLQFPLPPIETQNIIALNISNLISNIEKSKVDAGNLRLEAEQVFENAIFS